MSVELTTATGKEERSDEFIMGGLEQAMETQQGIAAMDAQTDAGYFAAMAEADLDAAEAPLIYLASTDSLKVWRSGLTLQAKREFLTQFWTQRDPTPGTPRNELREQFYNLITVANRQYREGGSAAGPGWKTDRGRVFVKYGRPAEMLDRPTPSGKSPPYQVWRYSSGKDTYYIFADRSGFGAYKLIATNNLRETQTPGFREILGSDALQDVSRWLGIDLFRSTGGQQDAQ
jgi:GWxTD domain-containing protein